jgi:hypothetical protein
MPDLNPGVDESFATDDTTRRPSKHKQNHVAKIDPLGMTPGTDSALPTKLIRRRLNSEYYTHPEFDRRNQPPDRPRHPRE